MCTYCGWGQEAIQWLPAVPQANLISAAFFQLSGELVTSVETVVETRINET